jgi:hypothetical protein
MTDGEKQMGDLDEKVKEFLSKPENKLKMQKRLRDEVDFSDDAIYRYTKIRLQIDTDPQ